MLTRARIAPRRGGGGGGGGFDGDLSCSVSLSGAFAGSSTAEADLTAGSGVWAGSFAGIATLQGDLAGAAALAAAFAGSSAAQGDLDAAAVLEGTFSGTAVFAGDARGTAGLAGASAGSSTTAGDLDGASALSGAFAGSTTTDGDLTVTSGGGFTPADIASLRMSLTIQLTGSPVSTWEDDTANGFDASQGDSARQPAVGTLNALAAPNADGSNDYLDGAAVNSIISNGDFEVWIVGDLTAASAGAGAYYLDSALITESDGWTAITVDSSPIVRFGYNGGAGDFEVTDAVNVLDSAPHVFRARIASLGMALRVDDRTEQTTTVNMMRTFTSNLRLFGTWDLSRYVAGTMHVWIFNAALSTSDRDAMYSYLASTYGVTTP